MSARAGGAAPDPLAVDWPGLRAALPGEAVRDWLAGLPAQVDAALATHGDWPRWRAALGELAQHDTTANRGARRLDADAPQLGSADALDDTARALIEAALRQLHPWRKGPFDIHGIHIDCEWRSDWKWRRLAPHIAPLAGRRVLDVGCGNGYHLWRMAGAGAALALGLDPTLLFYAQFLALRHFAGGAAATPVHLLPLGVEALVDGVANSVADDLRAFDTVFSMGVLHHRRSPIDHLLTLRSALRPGGELVLETLVVDGDAERVLLPAGRYARMRNVWMIPSPAAGERWLQRAGFNRARCVDVTATSTDEQRSSDWMRFESLTEALDPADPRRTVEGLPAPRRGIFIAERPGR